MSLKVVYDTNIIVSAIWKPGSIPAFLVELALNKQVRLFYSPPILQEYQEVLKRPKFGFNPQTVQTFIQDLRHAGTRVRPTQQVTAALDPSDNRFLECAQTAHADYLVTGNKKHFPFPEYGGTKIVNPRELAGILSD